MILRIDYCLFVMTLLPSKYASSNEVITSDGPVRGKLVEYQGVTFYSYQGIPYAEPPVGNLRFMPPVPKSSWFETLDATRERSVCPQEEGKYKREQMNEDCLYLNIYVPASKTTLNQEFPVLAYVHGGEFKSLSGNSDVIYGPQLFVDRDIILVTMNYRLGALGFLSLEVEEASGNAGLKDVLLALQWIKNNIKHFGGLPNKITLGGNSAGAVIVHYLMLTEKSTDLFQQALLISGSALGYRFLANHPKSNALALAAQLGINETDSKSILEKLKEINVDDLLSAQQSMGDTDERGGFRPFAPFVPCIEQDFSTAIIKKHPLTIIKSGIPQNVPIIAGHNSQEGVKMVPAILKNSSLVDLLNENFERCIPSNIEYPLGSEASKTLATDIKQFYFNGDAISKKNLQNFIDMISDTQFKFGIDCWIKYYKESMSSNKLYYYEFDFKGDLNWFALSNEIDYEGAAHADELGYLFVTQATQSILPNISASTRKVQKLLLTVFTDFIKTGNPTPECNTDQQLAWTETGRSGNYFVLNESPRNVDDGRKRENLQFWYDVYNQYYSYVQSNNPLEDKNIP